MNTATLLFIIGFLTGTTFQIAQLKNIHPGREFNSVKDAPNQISRKTIFNKRQKRFICDINTTETPEMRRFAEKLPSLCQANYPKIKRKLIADSFQPPSKIHIVFKKDQSEPGLTLGDTITLSNKHFTDHPDDLGAIVHELAHVAQSYPQDQNFWLTEGIADYIRYWRGYENAWSYPHCGPGSEHYTSGYWCSAAFLKFIEKKYDGKIIVKINKALRENTYNDSLFDTYTRKSLEQLWQDCLKEECAGGTP